MSTHSPQELDAAREAITSLISKCEKVEPKLKPDSAQYTLLVRRIAALKIAASLITRELKQ